MPYDLEDDHIELMEEEEEEEEEEEDEEEYGYVYAYAEPVVTESYLRIASTAIDVDHFYYSSEDDRDRPPTPPRVEPAIVAAAPRQAPQAAK